MRYIYYVFEYRPKYKYGDKITLGHYKTTPKAFENLKKAKCYLKKYKHAEYIKKVKLY